WLPAYGFAGPSHSRPSPVRMEMLRWTIAGVASTPESSWTSSSFLPAVDTTNSRPLRLIAYTRSRASTGEAQNSPSSSRFHFSLSVASMHTMRPSLLLLPVLLPFLRVPVVLLLVFEGVCVEHRAGTAALRRQFIVAPVQLESESQAHRVVGA